MNVNLRKFTLLFTACLLLCGLGSPGAFGQPPSLINFRGQLLDNGGQPVTASVAVQLRIFSAATGGTELYLEDMGYIEVRGGQYAFQFGANGNPDLASVIQGNAEAWVEVTVDNNALPRQRFVSVPYALNAGSAQIASGAVTREMLSQEVLNDLNRTQISNGSITREMLDTDLNQTISMGFSNGSFDIRNPFGWDGEFITHTDSNYTVPEEKVLVIISGKEISLGWGGKVFRQLISGYSIVPSNTFITSQYGWTGLLLDQIDGVSPVLIEDSVYQVPTGKKLVITSTAYTIFASGEEVFWNNSKFGVIESGQTLNIQSGFNQAAFSGYLIDENRSLGGGFISSTDQESSVTPDMLSDSILKYLRPEIVEEPSFTGTIRNGTRVELNPGVEGKYVTYQWYKDGEPIDGATSQLFTIVNFDVGYHDGNYTVVASNDFGDIESAVIELTGNSNDFRGVDISSMDFQGQDLSDALFDSTTIFSNGTSGASFSGTAVKLDNLTGSIDLRGVNLHGADLRGSDLSQAQFNEQTYITGANLSGTRAVFPVGSYDLTGSNVAGVSFLGGSGLTISSDTVLTEYDEELGGYVGASIALDNVSWGGVPNDFRGVNIAWVDLTGQDLSNVQFDSSTIFSVDFLLGVPAAASLSAENSSKGANLNLHGNVDLRGVNLYHANLTGSDLREANLNGTILHANNLTRVNLCGVDLASAQFGDYASSHTYDHTYYNSATIFPEGFNPNDYPGLVLVEDTFTVEGGQGSAPFFLISNDQGIVDFTSYRLRPGNTYAFRSWEISQEHSFMIGESYGDMESSMVYRGPLTRENEGSLMFLTIPSGFDGSLYYFCPLHSNMIQEFTLSTANHVADLNSTVSLEMIWVEPGTFTMGQSDISSASPEHEVTLTAGFYLGKYEVTQAQYEAVMKGNTDSLSATPSNWPNNPDRPVELVSYDDIQVFLTRLNAQEAGNIPAGWAYVLPTEAQWEYACRAGTTTAYSWGDSITTDNANYSSSGFSQTRDVGLYDANPWGFFDMHGNVWEWTADAYANYATGAQTDPFNVGTSGSSRVSRGGSWDSSGTHLRSASRSSGTPRYRYYTIGFRVGFQQQ